MEQRIVITGSAGRLGRAATKALLARGHAVFGIDRAITTLLKDSDQYTGDLPETEKLTELFTGAHAVIHLAATPDDAEYPRKSNFDNFETELIPNNVVGAYRVVEAARRAGVKRLILASSGQVIDGPLRAGKIPVTTETPSDPRYLYACTKVFLEALGQTYSRHHGINVIALRLGWCPRDNKQVKEISESKTAMDVYLSPGDAGRLFVGTVEANGLPAYAVLYATSLYTHQLRYDLNETQRLLDFKPQDRWPIGAEEF